MKKPTKTPTKKQLEEYKAFLTMEAANKAFDKWNKLNNVGQPWENGLGPHSQTIRKNLFVSGWLARDERRPRVSHSS